LVNPEHGCSYENQPYVVPIHFAYEDAYLYGFSTFGQKVKWMRANPKVCVQTDKIENQGEWISVIVYGEYGNCPSRNTLPSASMPVLS